MTQQAFKIIKPGQELTNYQQFQLNKYGNILGDVHTTPDGDLFESGIEELNRMAEWIDAQAEQQRVEQEYQTY